MATADAASVTPKQKVVLDGLNAGKAPKEIADEMGVTVNGVYRHMTTLREAGLIKGKAKSRTRGTRRRRSTTGRGKGNAPRHRNGRPRNTDSLIAAIEKAHVEAKGQIEEIDAEIERLNVEKTRLAEAIG